jgi:DNA-binding CsgD family transcriptional regulator
MARPSRAHLALVTDLLWPRAEDPDARRDEVIGRLAVLVHDLLAAQRAMLLRWDGAHHRYAIEIADSDGSLHKVGLTVGGASTPLPALARLRRGLVIDRPSENPVLDRQLDYLLGDTSAMLLPINTQGAIVGVLALRLAAPPRTGEAQLALVLAHHATAIISGQLAMPSAQPVRARDMQVPRSLDSLGLEDIPLSPREQAVVRLVAGGLRNKEIAARLGITEKTVKFHLTHVFEKLGAESRIEVVLWRIERDLASTHQQQQRNTP